MHQSQLSCNLLPQVPSAKLGTRHKHPTKGNWERRSECARTGQRGSTGSRGPLSHQQEGLPRGLSGLLSPHKRVSRLLRVTPCYRFRGTNGFPQGSPENSELTAQVSASPWPPSGLVQALRWGLSSDAHRNDLGSHVFIQGMGRVTPAGLDRPAQRWTHPARPPVQPALWNCSLLPTPFGEPRSPQRLSFFL